MHISFLLSDFSVLILYCTVSVTCNYEKKVKMQQFANEAKRKSLLGFISGFSADAELLKEIASWSTKELEILARMID